MLLTINICLLDVVRVSHSIEYVLYVLPLYFPSVYVKKILQALTIWSEIVAKIPFFGPILLYHHKEDNILYLYRLYLYEIEVQIYILFYVYVILISSIFQI